MSLAALGSSPLSHLSPSRPRAKSLVGSNLAPARLPKSLSYLSLTSIRVIAQASRKTTFNTGSYLLSLSVRASLITLPGYALC